MYRNKKSGIIGIAITIVILVLIVIFSNGEENSNFLQNAATNLIMPVQNGLTYLKNKLSGNNAFFTDIKYLKEENKQLKEKNDQLEQSLRELENIKTENETLKEYMNLTEKYGEYKTIPGYVINKDISNYSKTIVINIGKNDGVEENMTVIGNEGLVGHVVSVTGSTAKVQTIIDTASSGALVPKATIVSAINIFDTLKLAARLDAASTNKSAPLIKTINPIINIIICKNIIPP